ncbi:hypothetical protein B0H66DRAFT_566462 [Apodospora peruviana]|uniref:Conserved oligomeric Golgi complex subunit 1 n=1 Tax=Apodospora peruviana TaxID=516989 RepID=A0AAE0HV94_9PEZI|nr:hypothetical protein B0H66DRAFT_566462 [Apodospora peruviana]
MATMTHSTTDLSSLTSSAQIFSSKTYTLPQIRSLHKTLHDAIDDKAARLRTQVGGSYRELLGTADTIVAMKADMESVQTTLGRMGGRCGRAVVGGKVAGLGKFVNGRDEASDTGTELSVVARRRLLDACVLAVGKVLSRSGGGGGDDSAGNIGRGERLIMAAKICVLGRLLVKSLSSGSDAGGDMDTKRAERSLEGLRHKLLQRVKSALASVPILAAAGDDEKQHHLGKQQQQGDVLKALSAYSLPTNSGAQDVLRHFLRVRSEAMALAAEVPEDGSNRSSPKQVLRCLSMYTKTLQDVQTLVPHRLPDALAALKEDRLLADKSLRAMEGLRLDVYERWCGDEIRYFTPFIRHDDFDSRQAKEMLTDWAREGSEVFLRGLEKMLDAMVEFKAIVDLRTSVLKLWITEGGKVRGFDSSVMLDRIRDVVNGHMLQVLESKVHKLRLVGSEASAAVDAWREGTTDQRRGLWEADSFGIDLSNGAAHFAQDVIARLYGRNDAVSKAVTSYKSWFRVIDDVGQVVDQLKRQRWDNDVDGEIEDEETIEHRQKLLAREDPQKLSDHLSASLVKAYKDLDEHLVSLWNAHREGPNRGPIAMYFLRLLRDMRSRLPEDLVQVKPFGLAAVPSLHQTLAETVVISPLDELVTVALARRAVVGRSLWEAGGGGLPELPTLPSPGIFQFLRNLSMSMSDAGGDLWNPVAVVVLKKYLRKHLSEVWLESFEAVSVGEEEESQTAEEKKAEAEESGKNEDDGNITKPDDDESTPVASKEMNEISTEQQRKDLFVQWLFDISYLGFFLSLPDSSIGELKSLEEELYRKTELDNLKARERLVKTSQEYWKRTSLLFGLLT